MKTIRVAAAAIIKDNHVLAALRSYGTQIGWELPGGKIEPHETAEEAIVREIREELSAEIAVDEKLVQIEHDYPEFHLSMTVLAAHLKSEAMHLNEHASAKWLNAENLENAEWLAADRKAIPAIRAYLSERRKENDQPF